MSLAMKARQKVKKKGSPKDKVFGCDLLEHLQASGQEGNHSATTEVRQPKHAEAMITPGLKVLKSCADFVEEHGIVDGIYRLCGIASNVQKLRQEFDTERPPNLNKDTYLQDVHCVSSLCKAYFRELPNPLLTYQLYDKFADAVAIQLEEQRLVKIKDVLKDLPPPHYRTLEYLMRHLVHMASFSSHTNMHARNLAIVWAPNLLRSKDIEATGFNGTAAFMEVRIQSIVVEFILTHVEQLFGDVNLVGNESEGGATASLPPYSHEDYFRSLSYNIPSMLNQGDGPPQIRPYHTIIEISDHKRKGSVKTKKWKSIFNLGRSNHDSKRKLIKQDDIEENLGKIKLRPAKSMDSLSSAPYAADEVRKRSPKTLLPLRRESFGAQSNEDNKYTFKDGDGQQIQVEARNQNNPEYEEEATAKSEPTTPKPGRSSIIETPQGRSPKNAQSRAEKCVGVHISGPFSVTLPFHITSNLSRLTRGMECPSLNNPFEHQSLQRTCSKGEGSGDENIDIMQLRALVYENDKEERLDTPTDTTDDMATNTETTRIALEVQDTFSFLDTQDANQEPTPLNTDNQEENTCLEATTSGYTESCFPADCDILEDDLRNVFLNDMIGAGMQVEEFSVEPPPDDLSTDDDSDQMYFIPTGCLEIEDQPKDFEDNSEDVYLSACNDLSPLIQEFEVPLEFLDTEASQHSSTALAEKSSEHPICENQIEECNEIQSELQAPETQEVTSHDTLCMTFARDSEESKANEMDYLTHCELSRSLENYVTIKSGDISVANCVPEIFHEVHEIMQYNPSGSDLDSALCDNETIDPIPFEVIPAEYVIDHDATNETSSTEENISKLDNQTEHDNDLQWPPPPFVDTDCTATDCVTNKCLVESQVEYIPAAPQNVLQKVDYSNEIIDDKPNVDNKICSTQEYFKPTISKFPNQIQLRSINGIYPDGSVSMRLASTMNKTQQVKSVPVVPPKPQFAKLPPALKSTIHVSPAFTTNQDTQHKQSESHSVEAADSCSGSLQKQRSSGWRSGGSVSFDTAVALAKERQSPVRRMQTYCIGDSYDATETKDGNALHLQKLSLKPTGNRMGRPVSCVVRPNSNEVFKGKDINDAPSSTFLIQESMQLTQELSPKNRLSFPRLGKRSSSEDETYHNSTQQRRSLL